MIGHPSFGTLCDFVDDELSGDERTDVAEHLLACGRCRRDVEFLEELGAAAARVPAPEPPEGTLGEVFERRAAGERVILPAAERAPSQDGFGVGKSAAVAAVALLLAAAVLLSVPEADASRSSLRFQPERPRPGAQIDVTYRSAGLFPGRDTLLLRGRLREPGDRAYNRGPVNRTVARLVRREEDVFRGSFRLPDKVVYGAFAVEDREGTQSDGDAGRLWELSVHAAEGRPLFATLDQRVADMMGRSWEEAYATIRRMTEAYPDSAWGWHLLASYDGELYRGAELDSVMRGHRKRFRTLHARLSARAVLPPLQMESMARLARTVEDTAAHRHWRRRFVFEHPNYPWHLFIEENRLNDRYSGEGGRGRYLEALEPVWQELVRWPRESRVVTTARENVVNNALNHVDDAEEGRWFHRWMRRYRAYDRPTPGGLAREAAAVLERSDLRSAALRMLRTTLRWAEDPPPAYRRPGQTVAESQIENRRMAQFVLTLLGRGLLLEGDTAAALDTLRLASRRGWSRQALQRVRRMQAAAGDTVGAGRTLARLAALPRSDTASFRASWRKLGSPGGDEGWASWWRAARSELAEYVVKQAGNRSLRRPVRLEDADGETRRLTELSGDGPTVIVFWSRTCAPAVDALPRIGEVSRWLEGHGARLLLVTEHPVDRELSGILAREDVDVPTYHDAHSEAATAFENFGTPRHYVLDGSGRLRFRGKGAEELARVPRQVLALQGELAPRDAPSSSVGTAP